MGNTMEKSIFSHKSTKTHSAAFGLLPIRCPRLVQRIIYQAPTYALSSFKCSTVRTA